MSTLSGIPGGSDCCSPHTFPFIGSSYGNWGELDGAVGDRLTATITFDVTSLDNSGAGCGGIDPDTFPDCGFIALYLNSTQAASVSVPTAIGTYNYAVVLDGTTGEATIVPF